MRVIRLVAEVKAVIRGSSTCWIMRGQSDDYLLDSEQQYKYIEYHIFMQNLNTLNLLVLLFIKYSNR
jgi:hypothetical protein